MPTLRRNLLLGLAALALAGCALNPKPLVSQAQDIDADLHAYHSFAFVPRPTSTYSSIVERRLYAATRSQLERRGYVFDETEPDLLVNIGAMVQERQGLRTSPGSMPGMERMETEDYHQGMLAIDLVDVRRQQLVWRGVAEGRIGDAMLRDPGNAADKAVAAIFERYPLKPVDARRQ